MGGDRKHRKAEAAADAAGVPVVLGLPGDWIDASAGVGSHYYTFAGGEPVRRLAGGWVSRW